MTSLTSAAARGVEMRFGVLGSSRVVGVRLALCLGALLAGGCEGERSRGPRPVPTRVPAARPSDGGGAPAEARGDPGSSPGAAEAGREPDDRRAALPVDTDGDVTVEALRLGRGHVSHSFQVDERCALARAELDVGVDSMPDGFVELRAPSGRTAHLQMRFLQIDIVKTWDWASLEALHAERGSSIAGRWTFEARLAGADYSQPATGETAPMPTPEITVARLRFHCEPERLATETGSSEWAASWEPRARAPRPGANARALLAVRRDCAVDSVAVTADLGFRYGVGTQARLVTPDGRSHLVARVEATSLDGHGTYRVDRRVALPERPRSAGLWEILLLRGGAEIERAGLAFRCAEP